MAHSNKIGGNSDLSIKKNMQPYKGFGVDHLIDYHDLNVCNRSKVLVSIPGIVVVVKTGVAETEPSLNLLLEQDLTFHFFVPLSLGSIVSMMVETLAYIFVEYMLELVKLDRSWLTR